jgi:multidrug resistance efflux pump
MQNTQEYKPSISTRSLLSNLVIVTAGIGLIVWSWQLIRTRFTSVISRDAVINGVLTDIKTPAEGTISQLSVKTGDVISQGQTLITLKNERVSSLPVQTINTRINEQQAQLERAQAQLVRQLSLLQSLSADRQNQTYLEVAEAQDSTLQVESELQKAQSRYRIAQTSYKRSSFLREQGGLAQVQLDDAQRELEESKYEITRLEARLQAVRANQKAAQLGLSLSRARSNYDPGIRLQEMQLQIADQRQTIATLQQGIKDAQAELTQAKADLERKQSVVVNAPTVGVMWRLNAQSGKYVQPGESLGQLLDCSRRWIDVFVDEQAVRSLQPGTPATVELYGSSSQVLQGKVSLVRSGVGRLSAGEDVAVPSIPNLPRNTQVRVDLDSTTAKGNPNLFCFVGYTGRVTFKVK